MNSSSRHIWMDGEFVPWENASVHPMSNTFQYGIGVFEGLRSYKGDDGTFIFRLEDHTNRLFDSAKMMRLEIPFSREDLNSAQVQILSKNKMQAAYLRPMVYLGWESLGLHASNLSIHVMIAAWEWKTYLTPKNPDEGLRLQTSTYRRIHPNTVHAKAKACGHYVNSVLAYKEAKSSGFDEALLLDASGWIAEASTSNFFLVKNATVYTPFDDSILPGITRDTVIELCKDLGISLVKANLSRDDVYRADEAFLTGSAAEVKSVTELDRVPIGNGKSGPITNALIEKFSEVVNHKSPKHFHWLSKVSD